MFYCRLVTFCWLKYTSLVRLTCWVMLVSRSYVIALGCNNWIILVSLFDDGSLDGVNGAFMMSSSVRTCFLWHWPLIPFPVFFSYCSYKIWRFTQSVEIFISDCWVLLLDKNTGVHGVYPPHPVHAPTIPQTRQTSACSEELSRLIRFMHPRSRGRQRVRTSYLDLAGYSCLKACRNAFNKWS